MTVAEKNRELYERMLAKRGPDDPSVKAWKRQVDAEAAMLASNEEQPDRFVAQVKIPQAP